LSLGPPTEPAADGLEPPVVARRTYPSWDSYKDVALGAFPFTDAIEEIEGALVWPQSRVFTAAITGRMPILDGGVFHADGEPSLLSRYRGAAHFPVMSPLDEEPEFLPGRHLWGGHVRRHFGAFLVHSLGRLWALDRLRDNPPDSIVFGHLEGHKPPADAASRAATARGLAGFPYIADVLKLMAGDIPVRITGTALRVERLIVPEGFVNGEVMAGHPGFVASCAELGRRVDRLPGAGQGAEQGARKLYISRARLGIRASHFLLETVIEENFRRNGYAVIHPEQLPIEAQLRAMRGADWVVLADGSAVHVLAMVARAAQHIRVIARRLHTNRFVNQLRGFGVTDSALITAIRGHLCPVALPDARAEPGAGATVLDFAQLGRDLAAAGFIDPALWHAPDEAELARAMADYAAGRAAQPKGEIWAQGARLGAP
jgi:hypothetical protein